MKNDLVERYIYAVTRKLPTRSRDDVSAELRTLIDDMIEQRCGAVTPTQKDITVILTELGTPSELFAEYSGDGKKSLIGPPYYTSFIFIMKIVFFAFLAGMFIYNLVSFTSSSFSQCGDFSYLSIFTVFLFGFIKDFVSGIIIAFGIVTIIFAIFQHFKVNIDFSYNLRDLPDVPVKKDTIHKSEPIASIVFSVLITLIIFTAPSILSLAKIRDSSNASCVTIFDETAFMSGWFFVILLVILGISRDCVDLFIGRYCKKTMIYAVVLNAAAAITSVIWLSLYQIITPEFFSVLFSADINLNPNFIALAILLFAISVDTGVVIFRSLRAERRS